MSRRMSRDTWNKIETVYYQTRHMPLSLSLELERVSTALGRRISGEMVLAVALEYGLEVISRRYLVELGLDEGKTAFKEDFKTLFGGS